MTSAVLHRDTRFVPKMAVGGKGSYLFLEDGTKFLDSTGGAAVSCLGHGNEKVIQKVIKFKLINYPTAIRPSLAQRPQKIWHGFLTETTGGKLSKLFVLSSGR